MAKIHTGIGNHDRALCGVNPNRGQHAVVSLNEFLAAPSAERCGRCLHLHREQTQTPEQKFGYACQLAKPGNLLIVKKGEAFLIYRKMPDRNVFLADCKDADSLIHKIKRYAGHAPEVAHA